MKREKVIKPIGITCLICITLLKGCVENSSNAQLPATAKSVYEIYNTGVMIKDEKEYKLSTDEEIYLIRLLMSNSKTGRKVSKKKYDKIFKGARQNEISGVYFITTYNSDLEKSAEFLYYNDDIYYFSIEDNTYYYIYAAGEKKKFKSSLEKIEEGTITEYIRERYGHIK